MKQFIASTYSELVTKWVNDLQILVGAFYRMVF